MSKRTIALLASMVVTAGFVSAASARVVVGSDLTVWAEWEKVPGTPGFNHTDWVITTMFGKGAPGAQPWSEPTDIDIVPDTTGDSWVVSIFIPNWVDDEPLKIINGKIFLSSQVPIELLGIDAFDNGVPAQGFGSISPDPTNPLCILFYAEIFPNPDFEVIRFLVPEHPNFGIPIDKIVMHTVSLPAPGAAALLALFGVTGAFRRRTS